MDKREAGGKETIQGRREEEEEEEETEMCVCRM